MQNCNFLFKCPRWSFSIPFLQSLKPLQRGFVQCICPLKELIAALRALDDAEAFETTFHELQQAVEHHVAEEETEMFPLAEAELEAELEALGEQMQEVKQQQQSWSRG